MELTKKKKQEIVESHKHFIKNNYKIRQNQLDSILKKYNLDRIKVLKKNMSINKINDEIDNKEKDNK